MKFVKKLGKNLKRKKTVNPQIRICVECGSTLISMNDKSIRCKNCGTTRRFKKESLKSRFKKGDSVRIVESEQTSPIYKIKKIKKSQDGTILYLLKSDSENISLLYHESDESHLESV